MGLRHVWQSWMRLRRRTPPGFSGPNPIVWSDIDAFLRRTGVQIGPWELKLIEAIDDLYVRPPEASLPPSAAARGQPAVRWISARDGQGLKGLLRSFGQRFTKKEKGG